MCEDIVSLRTGEAHMTRLDGHDRDHRLADSAALFARLQRERDPRVRAALIERFLPLARKLASRYWRSNEPYEDLVQVACVGLVKAVDRFDPSRGHAFTSFAVPTIVGELKRHFRDHGWVVHVERSAQERARAITEADHQIRSSCGQPPSVHELAQYLELSIDEVLEGLQVAAARELVSLDAPLTSDDGMPVRRGEAIGELDSRLGLADDVITAREAAGRLPRLEREVLYLRFGADLSQTQIARRVGVSQMQVSRLLRRSLGYLREQLDGPDPDAGPAWG
jgi:RNA polymerase sigma-B factor